MLTVDLPPAEFGVDIDPRSGCYKWKPLQYKTSRAALSELYQKVPGPFPSLYEHLVLNFRWLEVFLSENLRLISNPPAPMLRPLLAHMTQDARLVEALYPLRLVPFAKAGSSYDPICFDLSVEAWGSDCRIFRVDHESILCDGRVGNKSMIFESFRSLVTAVVRGSEETSANG
jgi:hypothetical protein